MRHDALNLDPWQWLAILFIGVGLLIWLGVPPALAALLTVALFRQLLRAAAPRF